MLQNKKCSQYLRGQKSPMYSDNRRVSASLLKKEKNKEQLISIPSGTQRVHFTFYKAYLANEDMVLLLSSMAHCMKML